MTEQSCCVFWVLLVGELLWHLFDFTTDTAFYIESVKSAIFEENYSESKLVQRVALTLLVVNGMMLMLSQAYFIRVKLAIRRVNRTDDPNFLMRISELHFFVMLLVFLLEDGPGLCLFAIVQHATGDFSKVQQVQLGTSLVGSFVFLVIAYHRCVLSKSAQRAAEQATALDRSVMAPRRFFSAFKSDLKSHDVKAQNTRQAVINMVAEPGRAKKAKNDFEGGKRDVDEIMKIGIV
jgi:hypothetical protein